MRQFIKKFTLITFIALLSPFITQTVKSSENIATSVLEGSNLNALINIRGGMYLKKGHPVGFHYELLNRFAQHQRCNIKVTPVDGTNPWKELAEGRVDIVVADAARDTIPDEYSGLFISSLDLNDYEQVWVVTKEKYPLLQNLNYWFGYYQHSREYDNLVYSYYRYYERDSFKNRITTHLSPYDSLIKKYSATIGWDWRLLASLIYQESKFSLSARSFKGACGLMQIKNSTAKQFNIEDVYDPEENIRAGTLYINRLIKLYNRPEIDSLNQVKFVLAAYNAGEGRLNDIRRAADFLEINANDWENAKEVLGAIRTIDRLPQELTCLSGFKGTETIKYVDEIISRYELYSKLVR